MTDELKMPVIGGHVVYTDSVGKKHDALVTNVFGLYCINLVYVEDDENQTDGYGRKIARQSSNMRRSENSAHGNFWEL